MKMSEDEGNHCRPNRAVGGLGHNWQVFVRRKHALDAVGAPKVSRRLPRQSWKLPEILVVVNFRLSSATRQSPSAACRHCNGGRGETHGFASLLHNRFAFIACNRRLAKELAMLYGQAQQPRTLNAIGTCLSITFYETLWWSCLLPPTVAMSHLSRKFRHRIVMP